VFRRIAGWECELADRHCYRLQEAGLKKAADHRSAMISGGAMHLVTKLSAMSEGPDVSSGVMRYSISVEITPENPKDSIYNYEDDKPEQNREFPLRAVEIAVSEHPGMDDDDVNK
jgi:hypothetical protein